MGGPKGLCERFSGLVCHPLYSFPETSGASGFQVCREPVRSHVQAHSLRTQRPQMPCQSRMPNCGTQFCFHRNQFEGIFIFNYSATSNFPFIPRPDRRREIAYVNHPRKPLTSLKSPLHSGSLGGALGMCPGFSETNGDTRWPSAPDSGTLAGTCSPCQGERQKISMPWRMTFLGTIKGKQPLTPSFSTVPIHPAGLSLILGNYRKYWFRLRSFLLPSP